MSEPTTKTATLRTTDSVGKFFRDQAPPVVLPRSFPACMHNPLRSSDAGNQPANFGGIYDDECLQHTPVQWNYGRARSSTGAHVYYLDRVATEDATQNPFNRLLKWLRSFANNP